MTKLRALINNMLRLVNILLLLLNLFLLLLFTFDAILFLSILLEVPPLYVFLFGFPVLGCGLVLLIKYGSFRIVVIFKTIIVNKPFYGTFLLWGSLGVLLIATLFVSTANDFSSDDLWKSQPSPAEMVGTWKITHPRYYIFNSSETFNWQNTRLILHKDGTFEMSQPTHDCLFAFRKMSPSLSLPTNPVKGNWDLSYNNSNTGKMYKLDLRETGNSQPCSILIVSYRNEMILNWNHTSGFNRGCFFQKIAP